MSQKENSVLNYVPGQVEELLKVNRKITDLKSEANNLGQQAALDIMDGWSTGDKLLDFVLVACTGSYDDFVYKVQYRRIQELGLRKPGQKVLIIQKAIHEDESGVLLIKNIHLATLRKDVVETDIDTVSIRFPVEPGYISWREFITPEDEVLSAYQITREDWLTTGPLWNNFCDFSAPEENEDSIKIVPELAVCDVELVPESASSDLWNLHEINPELLDRIFELWVRSLSSS